MDIDYPYPSESYTILRIKRKRTEEPLDALVVESESRVRRKKSRGGGGVFQFAQTIEHDVWEDEKRHRELQDQISRIARENMNKKEPQPPSTSAPSSTRSSPSSIRPKDESNRRYTIIPQDLTSVPEEHPRYPTSPPKVISYKDVPRKTTPFKLYDAVLSGADNVPASPLDPEMEKFIPMLNDYLKLHDILPPPSSNPKPNPTPTPKPIPTSNLSLHSRSPSSDYVWDIFYHRPVTLSEWNEAAKVATLTGLPPSITDPYDSGSDSEPEDEADEDSNEEDYYKNDYPDEDPSEDGSDGSDIFHEGSDHDDLLRADDGDERYYNGAHDWR